MSEDKPRISPTLVMLIVGLASMLLVLGALTVGKTLLLERDCDEPKAKACDVNSDCQIVAVGTCGFRAFNAEYAPICRKPALGECAVTDTGDVHAVCRSGQCSEAAGF